MANSKDVVAPNGFQWIQRNLSEIDKFCSHCEISKLSTANYFKCEKGCKICQKCMEKSVIAEIRRLPNMELKCPILSCQEPYYSHSLKGILTPGLFQNIFRLEKAQNSEIAHLECCPNLNCDFFASVPEGANIIECLNPNCMKRTCRWCKGPAHIPNGCIASQENVKARTYVEMKMSEAFLRTCSGCKSKYYIEDGCSVVKCICGVKMCYYCDAIINTSRNECTAGCYARGGPKIYNAKNVINAAEIAMNKVDDKLTIEAIDKIIQLLP